MVQLPGDVSGEGVTMELRFAWLWTRLLVIAGVANVDTMHQEGTR